MREKTGGRSLHVKVYERESKILKAAQALETGDDAPPEELKKHFKQLVKEYKKLLRQAEKITYIGDSNQRKLFAAYEQIEIQNKELDDARREADRANSAKSEFLAKMSHEIRTPMNAILGMTEMTLMSHLDEEQKDCLLTVKDAGRNLLHVINDILDFSRIEAGRMTLEQVDFALEGVIRSVVKILAVTASQKKLALRTVIAPDTPAVIKGDYVRLKQIIINLAANAIKFTETGEIVISVRPADAKTKKGNIALEFSVRDTGIGIPEDKLEKVFEDFAQADSSVTRNYGGTGLGLAICQQLVHLMEGAIWVTSQVGEGSTFTFTAVFEPGDPEAAAALAEETAIDDLKGQPLKILLAEDNPASAKMAMLFLDKLGHTAVHAANGKEVLKHLEAQPFDVILMDMEMPELSGIETTLEIRKREKAGDRGEGIGDREKLKAGDNTQHPTLNTQHCSPMPIFAMTAHSLPEFREKAEACGMSGFVTKPLDLFHLARLLTGILPVTKPAETAGSEQPTPQPPAEERNILNSAPVLERLRGNEEMYGKFCAMVRDEIPGIRAQLKTALAARDLETLTHQAHYMKGSAANIGAEETSHHAGLLETTAREKKDIDRLTPLFNNLDAALTDLEKTL